MYTDNQSLHPKHKFIVAQMALNGESSKVIDFYRCVHQMLEYGATSKQIVDGCAISERNVFYLLKELVDAGIAYKQENIYYINSNCITDKHYVAGMNALGYR